MLRSDKLDALTLVSLPNRSMFTTCSRRTTDLSDTASLFHLAGTSETPLISTRNLLIRRAPRYD